MHSRHNLLVLLFFIVFVIIIGGGYFFYWRSPSISVYRQAKSLYENGDIQGAFEKVNESLKINNKNTKSLHLRSKLYLIIQDQNRLKDAKASYSKGLQAYNNGDFFQTADDYRDAIKNIDLISKSSQEYSEGQKIKKSILDSELSLNQQLSVYYYNQALSLYKDGNFQGAYLMASKAPIQDKVTQLKDDSAYQVGLNRYNSIIKNSSSPASFYKDAIYWLNRVSSSSSEYKSAQEMIRTLNNVINQ